jgi:hypothetical protein
MPAMQVFEQNDTKEQSSNGTMTHLDSTTIYPINSVIFHPLGVLWPAKIENPYHIPWP